MPLYFSHVVPSARNVLVQASTQLTSHPLRPAQTSPTSPERAPLISPVPDLVSSWRTPPADGFRPFVLTVFVSVFTVHLPH